MPKKRMEPLIQKADPYAEAAMVNGPVETKAPKKSRLLGLFGGRRKEELKKKVVLRQTDLLNPEMAGPRVDSRPEPGSNEHKEKILDPEASKPLIAEDPIAPKDHSSKEDDHLEIPAFLRRQAN